MQLGVDFSALCHEAQAVAPRPGTNSLYRIRAIELREESAQRILARHLITSLANQVKPFAIVDADRSLGSLLEESNCDPLQSLPSETAIKIINPELGRLAQNPVEIV